MPEDRPYRPGTGRERALNELRIGARRQFDLDVVGALLRLDQYGALEHVDSTFPPEWMELETA